MGFVTVTELEGLVNVDIFVDFGSSLTICRTALCSLLALHWSATIAIFP